MSQDLSKDDNMTRISGTTLNSSCDLLAALQKLQNDDENEAKESTDYETIHNQNIIERILNVLDNGIEKLKCALIIPYLLENPIELQKLVPFYDLEKLYKCSEMYCENQKDVGKSKLNDFICEISRAIEIIYYNKENREKLSKYLNNIPIENLEILDAMKENRKYAERRLKRSAVTEIATERIIHHIYHYNEKLKKQIKDQKAQLDKKEINTKWQVSAKQGLIKKYQEDLAFKKWENSIKVKRILVRSNDEMERIYNQQEYERHQLIEEFDRMNQIYDKFLKDNIQKESVLREKKNSYVDKLQTLIKKYDTDILIKITEHEELVAQKLTEQKKIDKFMIEFNEQEVKYKTLHNTMLEEKHRAQREKMLMFMMNRAARTIQKYWRQFVKSRKKKRGKSKGKGRGKKK